MVIIIRNVVRSLFLALIVFAGCGTSKIAVSAPLSVDSCSEQVKVIAMMPGGGVLAESIAVELTKYNYTVIDSEQVTALFLRLNLSEIEMYNPSNLKLLKDKGIDSYLIVKCVSGRDDLPQSASVRLNKTSTGELLAGVSWENGWGGQSGSISDRVMRKNVSSAAAEIVANLMSSR